MTEKEIKEIVEKLAQAYNELDKMKELLLEIGKKLAP